MSSASGAPQPSDVCRLDRALRRLQNDRGLLIDLAKIFFEDRAKIWDELKAGLQRSEIEVVRRSAHTLKGLVSNFDAGPAERGCLAVEQAAANGNFTDVANLLPELQHRLNDVEDYLRTELGI